MLTLEVVFSPLIPVLNDIIECDVNADGLATFNLSSIETQVIDENPNIDIIVTYYNSQADADSGLNLIDAASFANIDNTSQTIFVRAENLVTNCYSTSSVNLVVDSSC